MILHLLSLFVLIAALFGYMLWASLHFRVHSALAPAVVCSSIVILLFFSGLLNILTYASWVILAGGLVCFIRGMFLLIGDHKRLTAFISPGLVFFCGFFIVGSFLVKDSLFFQYDHFSHWGLIVKEMERIGGLPNDSTIISFTNYPPGTALFLYFFVHFLGFGESVSLIAHVFLFAAFMSVPLVFLTWKQPIAIISMITVMLVIQSSTPHAIFELLVDPLLGYIAAAAVLVFILYKNQVTKLLFTIIPILGMLILTKDSGKLFFVAVLLYMFIYLWIEKKETMKSTLNKKAVGAGGLIIGLPLMLDFLWKGYVEAAYLTNYEDNKFAITLNTFLSPGKSPEFITNFFPKMIAAVFNWTRLNIHILIGSLVLALLVFLLVWLSKKTFAKQLMGLISFSILFFGFYLIMLFTMYFFLMPEGEALALGGFNRYFNSMAIFLSVLLSTQAFLELNQYQLSNFHLFKQVAYVLIGIFFFYFATDHFGSGYAAPINASTLRSDIYQQYQELEQSEKLDQEDQLVVIDTSEVYSKDYIEYIIDYERSSLNNVVVTGCEEDSVPDLSSADFLLTVDLNENVASCLSQAVGFPVSSYSTYSLE